MLCGKQLMRLMLSTVHNQDRASLDVRDSVENVYDR